MCLGFLKFALIVSIKLSFFKEKAVPGFQRRGRKGKKKGRRKKGKERGRESKTRRFGGKKTAGRGC